MRSEKPNLPGWLFTLLVAIGSASISALAVWALSLKGGGGG